MITIKVNIENLVTGALEKYRDVLDDRALLHDLISYDVAATVRSHLLNLNSRSPNTGYFGLAAQSVETAFNAQFATIIIRKPGIGLRRRGGTVTPGRNISTKTGKPTTSVALPTKHVPIVNQNRTSPGDMPLLAFVPNRKGGDTTGYLVEGEKRIAKRGKSKGKYIVVAKKDGNMMYVLRKKTEHQEDPSVLPSDEELKAVAVKAIQDLLETFNQPSA